MNTSERKKKLHCCRKIINDRVVWLHLMQSRVTVTTLKSFIPIVPQQFAQIYLLMNIFDNKYSLLIIFLTIYCSI